MERVVTAELGDDPALPRGDVERLMAMVRWANRRLGGIEAVLGHLRRWSAGWEPGRRVTMLDIATGSADVPLAAVRWARRKGFDLRVVGVDRHPAVLEIARERIGGEERIELIHADAMEVEERFGAQSFDVVHAGSFLHHLKGDVVVRVLRAMDRVAREGIIWNDLIRSHRGVAVGYLLGLGRGKTVRHDLVASLRAGFIRSEVRLLTRRAGIGYAAYQENFLQQRFTMAGLREERAGFLNAGALTGARVGE